jgi:light-regulated signal transduction histidine kinase (bacteriophytochrome)
MEIGPYDGMVYEAIRRYVSSALKGALILEERTQAENQLIQYRDFLEERVNERTKELNEINFQLQQEIIERKQAEEKYKTLNEELEARVLQRTTQLENANKNLESFSYSVSHDLRAPLRAITGFSAILLEDHLGDLSPGAQSLLSRISSQAKQMNQLILDLLAFSRIDRQELNKQSVNCTTLAQRVLDELLAEHYADCVIETKIADLPFCLADPALLKQVFINLISNAIKFSCNREKPCIQIFSDHKNGKDIYIIKDNGVGFDPLYQDKLFVVFQRLHDSKEFEGTGVGLAIVKRIITRHGGQIWAEGAVDQGATFYFTLE